MPTRDRPGPLGRCLEALARETLAPLETIVVDDGSRDAEAVAATVARFPDARLVRLRGGGPAAARNAGARAARSRFVCFTDDDCEPDAEWAERLAARLRAGAAAVAGATTSGSSDALAQASQTVANYLADPDRPSVAAVQFAASNNLGCRAEVLADVAFDEAYPQAAGEDRDWCARLAAAGHVLEREPCARVIHHQDLTPESFWLQHVRYGRGAWHYRRAHPAGGRAEPPSFYVGLVRRGFELRPAVGLLVCAAQLATGVGFAREWLADLARATRLRVPAAGGGVPQR